MLCIIDTSTEPCFNLAAEEYLLKEFSQPIFRLWRNDDAVIVGRYQNTLAEINAGYASRHGIKVVRRLTGGGAVYHDPGNLNYTFIEQKVKGEDSAAMFRRFTAPILDAIRSLGIEASLEGRNDLLIEGRKFSGNAICLYRNRVLQHGTLLFSTSEQKLSAVLKEKDERFRGKAVDSNRRGITNISSHLKRKMDIEEFTGYLAGYIRSHASLGEELVPYSYTEEDIRAICHLRDTRYSRDEWNFGKSPDYRFSNRRRFNGGTVEVCFNVAGGKIAELSISGDYFFTRPTEEFCALLTGTPHDFDSIRKKTGSVSLGEYFFNISPEELTELFF